MIIHDFNLVCVPFPPNKTETPLVIDPNAVLPLPGTVERLKPIPWRCGQVAELSSAVYLPKLASCNLFDGPKPPAGLPLVKPFGLRAAE